MTRQLLPRQRTQTPAPVRPGVAPAAGARPAPAAPARGLRRPVVLGVVAAGTVVLAGLAWTLVRTGDDGAQPGPSSLAAATTPAATASPSAPAPSSVDAVPSGSVDTPSRDPFGGAPPAPAGAPTTQPPPPDVVSGTVRPSTTTTPATTRVPATSPTGTPAGGGPAPTTTPAPTVTVTATAPGSAVYVGLYAWNGVKASFRVNARTYSEAVGATFGPQLTFTAIVPGSPRCATLTYRKSPFRLCPGQVVQLP